MSNTKLPPASAGHMAHTYTPTQMQNTTEIMTQNATEIMFVHHGIIGNCFKDVATSKSVKL